MSANINYNNGKASFAFNAKKGLPWWGGGQSVDGLMTSQECLIEANLNFDVESVDVFTKDGGRIPNTRAIRRTDNKAILTHDGKLVTPQYKIYNNIEAFDFIDDIVVGSNAVYETAGCLGMGETVFITAALESFKLVKDEAKPYLLFALFHDGSGAVKLGLTTIRVVCQNTLNQALSSRTCISIVHKGNMKEKVLQATNKLGIMTEHINRRNANYELFAKAVMSDKLFNRFIAGMFLDANEKANYDMNEYSYTGLNLSTKKTNIINAVTNFYHTHPTQQDIIGTAWGAFNAITGYATHIKNYTDNDHKFNNLVLGKETKIDKAYDLLLDYSYKAVK